MGWTSLLYAVSAESLLEASSHTSALLGVPLVSRDSLVRGGSYYHHRDAGLVVSLQENLDIDVAEGEPVEVAEVDFPQHRFLLYISVAGESNKLLHQLDADTRHFTRLRGAFEGTDSR